MSYFSTFPPSSTSRPSSGSVLTQLPWISVTKKPGKFTPVVSERSTSTASSGLRRSKKESQRTYFENSNMLFNENEIDIIEKHSPSPLSLPIQIDTAHKREIERVTSFNPQMGNSNSTRSPHPAYKKQKQTQVSKIDSVISFTSEEDFDDEIELNQKQHGSEDWFFEGSGPITTDDIREHIWVYCEERDTKKVTLKPTNFLGNFAESHTADIEQTGGRKMIVNRVNKSSDLEDPKTCLNADQILTPEDQHRIVECKKRMESSFSALVERQFLEKNKRKIPYPLSEVNFNSTAFPRRKNHYYY